MEGLISVRAYTWRDLYLRGPTVGIEKTVQNMLWQC